MLALLLTKFISWGGSSFVYSSLLIYTFVAIGQYNVSVTGDTHTWTDIRYTFINSRAHVKSQHPLAQRFPTFVCPRAHVPFFTKCRRVPVSKFTRLAPKVIQRWTSYVNNTLLMYYHPSNLIDQNERIRAIDHVPYFPCLFTKVKLKLKIKKNT